MRIAPSAVALAVISCASLARAGRGFALLVPPVEVDTGAGEALGPSSALTGASTELLAGVHWASLYWRPTPIDFGVGYIGVARGVVPDYAARTTTPMIENDNMLRLDGAYVDLAYAIYGTRHWRSWLAVRGEWLHAHVNQTSFSTKGVAVRLATEVFAQVVGGGGGHRGLGVIAGTFALGLYVEASHRNLAPELGPNAVTAGLSLRLPFIFAAGG